MEIGSASRRMERTMIEITRARHGSDGRNEGRRLGVSPLSPALPRCGCDRDPTWTRIRNPFSSISVASVSSVVKKANYVPATVMHDTRKLGLCTELRVSRSSPTPSMLFHRSSKLIDMVTSLTG